MDEYIGDVWDRLSISTRPQNILRYHGLKTVDELRALGIGLSTRAEVEGCAITETARN